MEERIGDFIVSEEFAGLHKALSAAEFDQLEQNVLEAGRVRDKIKLWGEYVLDGVHRLKIAVKHALPFETEQVEVENKQDARRWIAADQLGRRNLSDAEMQRIRVELAKAEGTLAAAEATGVTRRTVQRQIQAERIKGEMGADIRKRLDDGSLIATQKQLKEYDALNDTQKLAVDEKLRRNKELLFGAALPKDKTVLGAESMEKIQASPHLSGMQKRKLSTGSIHADERDVAAFEELAPEQKVLVSNVLELPESDDLGDAIRTVKAGLKPISTDNSHKIGKLKEKMHARIEELDRFGEDLKAIGDKSGHKAYKTALAALTEAVDSWR